MDKLNAAINAYLISLDPDFLSDDDHRRVAEILSFATHMEQAGDIVDKSLLGVAMKKLRRGLTFSKEGQDELLDIIDRLIANVRAAASLFMTGDDRAARLLAAEKEAFRNLEAAATASHFERLRAGRTDTAETSSLHLDALRDLKRVNAHLVAAAAYPVLERNGELLIAGSAKPTKRYEDQGGRPLICRRMGVFSSAKKHRSHLSAPPNAARSHDLVHSSGRTPDGRSEMGTRIVACSRADRAGFEADCRHTHAAAAIGAKRPAPEIGRDPPSDEFVQASADAADDPLAVQQDLLADPTQKNLRALIQAYIVARRVPCIRHH